MVLIEEVHSPKASERKDEGNAFFAKSKYQEAIDAFSDGIRKQHDKSLSDPSVLYSNRSMCYVKLADWKAALADSNDAIKLNKNNAKAWHRKGQCLVKLKRYADARKAFDYSLEVAAPALKASIQSSIKELDGLVSADQEAPAASPPADPAPAASTAPTSGGRPASAATSSAPSSKSKGNTKSQTTSGEAKEQREFAHPAVKIQYVPSKGRGLITTKAIKRGELLVQALPVFTAKKCDAKAKVAGMIQNFELSEDDARLMLQLHSETGNNTLRQQVLKRDDLPIPPSVDGILMRCRSCTTGGDGRGGKKVTSDTAERLTPKVIAEILDANAYGSDDDNLAQAGGDDCGLWLLPSFVNHSCLSNVTRRVKGQLLEIRACRDLEAGEELLTTYCPTTQPLYLRESALKSYGFTPNDVRCRVERELLEKVESEKFQKESLVIGQVIDPSDLSKTKTAFGKLKHKIEARLREIVDSEKAGKLLEKINAERSSASNSSSSSSSGGAGGGPSAVITRATVFDWLRANFLSVFAGEAMASERTNGGETELLFRQAAGIVSSVFPSCPYETHFLSRAQCVAESQFTWACYAGGGEQAFRERYPDLPGAYQPTAPLTWSYQAGAGAPPSYVLELANAEDVTAVDLSEKEVRIKRKNSSTMFASLPVDANYLLGAEPVKRKSRLFVTMGVKRRLD